MDAFDMMMIVIGIAGMVAIVWGGILLDRRSQRIRSTKWMRNWMALMRVRNDLFRRWQGPMRLEDQRAAAPTSATRKRKPATPRRKRSRKPTR